MEKVRPSNNKTLSSPQFPDLNGQSVLITGGANGIGAGLVEGFLQQGCRVAFLDKDESNAKKLLKKLSPKKVLFLKTNFLNANEIKRSVTEIINEFKSLDILVNNVANDQRHSWENASAEEWESGLAINLSSYFFTTQAVLPSMIKHQKGNVINLSSNCYLLGLPGYPAYLAAKAAIVSLTKSLAKEMGEHNLRVNAVLPGWVMTKKQKELWATPEAIKQCLEEQSLKKLIAIEDIVGPALFLASRISQMISGQSLIVDGGRA